MSGAIDLTGQQFGRLIALNCSGSNRYGRIWKCQCECGNTVDVSVGNLRSGHTKSCGCLSKEIIIKRNAFNSTIQLGNRYGKLTVIEHLGYYQDNQGKNHAKYLCRCDCGNFVEVHAMCLSGGGTQSCGCLAKAMSSQRRREASTVQIGNTYGRLTVIGDAGTKLTPQGRGRHWSICQCECGNIVEKMDNSLRGGFVQSCGCLRSSGEDIITKILDENHIVYRYNQSFEELTRETGRALRFDFIIYDNQTISRFIEFDGPQHETGWKGDIWSDSDSYEIIHERDIIKNNFCLAHNYILIRIPYYMKNILTLEHIMGDKYRIKRKEEKENGE